MTCEFEIIRHRVHEFYFNLKYIIKVKEIDSPLNPRLSTVKCQFDVTQLTLTFDVVC